MEPHPDTVDPASLAPPYRALLEGLQAQNAALGERNRELEGREPEAVVEGLRHRVASLTEHNRRLEHLLRELRRTLFAKKSEKLPPGQLQLAFEALEGALAEAEEAAAASTTPAPRAKRPDARRNLGYLPEHLPHIEQVIEPESTQCPCGGGEMARIGEDRTERLDIVPAQLRVLVTGRPKYACRVCEQGITQAPAPAHLIEGAIPSEGALAHVLVSKFADHLPLYRQSQMLARSGLDVHRSTLAGWVGKASFHLRPLVACLAAELKTSQNLGVDETPVRVLDPGRGKTKTGYLWTMVREERAWCGAHPPGGSMSMPRAAAAHTARSGSRGSRARCTSTATAETTGCAGHSARAGRWTESAPRAKATDSACGSTSNARGSRRARASVRS